MQIGLGHFTFLHLPPVALVRLARQVGFGFVGLRFHPVAEGLPHWLPSPGELAELRQVMQGEGIALYDIETVVLGETFDPQAVCPAMDAAANLGGQRVNVCADVFPGLTDRFAQLCALAEERGLGVDIEPMRWRGVNTPAACRALLVESGASNAAYLVDTLHHSRCGGTVAEIAAAPVRSAQICDAPAQAPATPEGLLTEAREGRLLPGDGGLPLQDILAALPPGTVLSVELPNAAAGDDLERARAIHAATAALLKDLAHA